MQADRVTRCRIESIRRRRAPPCACMTGHYPVGPSWQDCGAVGESWRQVGTSHFEQAASESPSASEETIAIRSRTPRSALPRTFVRILSTPYAPYYSAMAHNCDLLAARLGREGFAAGLPLSYAATEFKDLTTRGNGHGDKSIRLDGLTPGVG